MDQNEIQKLEAIFHELLETPAGPLRDSAAARLSRGDPELARKALQLVESDERAESANQTARLAASASHTFGNYRTVRLLGVGGMGAVYLAERADGQFQQSVAVKVIAPHVAGEAFRGRFLAERQILAALSHPNITKLLDGGVSADGTPYLVMEYVAGQPLDEYCDTHKLSIKERLELFLKVTAPVAYAHRNLVVHRDLKPSNILVTGEGEPMLLDFGTAKLLAAEEALATLTLPLLTLRYSSPEQRARAPITTSADVFSLGVILYELMTGAWPFGDPASPEQMLELYARETAMTPPEAALSEAGSRARSSSLRALRGALAGDLRNILAKALAPAPDQRYESVQALATDIERWLNGMTISARPASLPYRLGKLLRRHRLAAAAATVFILGLTASAVVAIREGSAAHAETRRAERVNQFLNDMLASSSKNNFDPQTFTVRQMLDAAEPKLESSWKDDPLIEATLRTSLGSSYAALQRVPQAKVQLEKAAETFHKLGRPADEARALMWLGANALNDAGFDRATNYYHDSLAILNRLGKDAPPLLVFQAKANLARMESMFQRNPEECGRILTEALDLAAREPSIPRSDAAFAQSTLGATLLNAGKYPEAEAALRKSVAMFQQDGSHSAQNATPLYLLVILYSRQGNFRAACNYASEYYSALLNTIGAGHPSTAEAGVLWARYRADVGETGSAVDQILAAMPLVRKTYPALSIQLWTPLASAAHAFNLAGRFPEAERYAREELAVVDAARSPEVDLRRAQTLWELGLALQGQNRLAEGSATLEHSARVYEESGPAWVKRGGEVRKLKKLP